MSLKFINFSFISKLFASCIVQQFLHIWVKICFYTYFQNSQNCLSPGWTYVRSILIALVYLHIHFHFSFLFISFMNTSVSLINKCVKECFFLLAHFCSELYRSLKVEEPSITFSSVEKKCNSSKMLKRLLVLSLIFTSNNFH